jgi:hypothetical protein
MSWHQIVNLIYEKWKEQKTRVKGMKVEYIYIYIYIYSAGRNSLEGCD